MTETRQLAIAPLGLTGDRACDCANWRSLGRTAWDLTLAGLMEWAWMFHRVHLQMLVRGDHVAICTLVALKPGEGRARAVMNTLTTWADCARVTLELTPSTHWGADLTRLTDFYELLGFVSNEEPENPFRVREDLIRYPVPDGGHQERR